MATYSHSKIGTFETCPLKYKFKYVDRTPTEDFESVEAFLGSRVHETLEKLYDLVRNGRIPDEQFILDYYEKQWTTNWSDAVRIVKPDLTADDYRATGRTCIERYYRHYHPFNQGLAVALEMQVPITLDDDGQYKMTGFIDRVDKMSDGVFEIHDYKTNQTPPSQEEKDQDRQLALYEIGLRDYFGEVRQVELVWHYVRADLEIRSRRTGQELEELRAKMIAKIQEIEAATVTKNFPACESRLCNWCEYRPLCPIWKHLYAIEEQAAQPTPLPDDGPALVNQLASLAIKRKELQTQADDVKAQMEQVEAAIIEFAKQHDYQRIFGADRQATVKHVTELKVPTKTNQLDEYEQMLALLRQSPLWLELTDFSSAKLKDMLGKPEGKVLRDLLGALVKQEEEWRVSLRKRKDEE
ncbi:MAG: PD-(D/E)XK nuclease family protein [Verrucomicrobia bacterium]|nr:PD-(D/E)XK nuclease family protein [Verrucomicrobiota bacterium]